MYPKTLSKLTLILCLAATAWAADPKQVLAEVGSGRVVSPTNFWGRNSNELNAVVARQLPVGGTTGQSLVKASGSNYDVTWSTITGGEGGGAPTSASYLVLGADGTLTSERVFTPGTGLGYTDAGVGGAFTLSVSYGTTSGTAAEGNDARLSNARTPTAHKTSHATGGGDALTASDIGAAATSHAHAEADVTGLVTDLAGKAATVHAHAEADVTGLVTDLAGKAPSSHTHGLAEITDEGTAASRNVPAAGDAGSTEVVLGSDTRMTNARTPTTHSHNWLVPAGGSTDQVLAKSSATDGDLKWATAASGSSPTTTRGDLIVRGASVDERLAVGSRGAVLMSNGTDPFWLGPRNGLFAVEEFLSYSSSASTTQWSPWMASGSGGAIAVINGEAGHPGIVRLSTSTSATGAQSLCYGASSTKAFLPGSGLLYHAVLARIPTASSDTETFSARHGFGNATYAMPTDGAYIEYTHNTNSGKWLCWTAKASAYYSTDSTVTMTANTWYLLEVQISADATSATFWITPVGGSTTTITDSTSSHIPTAGVNHYIQIVKRLGATPCFLEGDVAWLEWDATSARW